MPISLFGTTPTGGHVVTTPTATRRIDELIGPAHGEGARMVRLDLPRLRVFLLGTRRRVWTPGLATFGHIGIAGIIALTVILAVTTPTAILALPHHALPALLLAVFIVATGAFPLTFHRPNLTCEIILEGGVVVLALATLPVEVATVIWATSVLISDLHVRPWLSVSLANAAVSTLSLIVAALAWQSVLPGDWPHAHRDLSVLTGIGIAVVYALVEALGSDVIGRYVMRAFTDPPAWRETAAAVGSAAVLGGIAGAALTVSGGPLAFALTALPMFLAIGRSRALEESRAVRHAKGALVEALTGLAAAEDAADIDRVLCTSGAAIIPSGDVSIVHLPPERVPEPSIELRHLPITDPDPDPADAPQDRRFLRLQVKDMVYRLEPRQIADVTVLVEAAAVAARRIRDRERMAWAAQHDPLTGLLTRQGFWESASPGSAPSALMLVDLDGFKTVNDTFGHDRGDQVLVAVAGALERCVPRGASIARWGGDEFVVAFPEPPACSLDDVARSIVAAVERDTRRLGPGAWVSASVGVAVQEGSRVEATASLLQRADAAMYRVKAGRRDSGPGDADSPTL